MNSHRSGSVREKWNRRYRLVLTGITSIFALSATQCSQLPFANKVDRTRAEMASHSQGSGSGPSVATRPEPASSGAAAPTGGQRGTSDADRCELAQEILSSSVTCLGGLGNSAPEYFHGTVQRLRYSDSPAAIDACPGRAHNFSAGFLELFPALKREIKSCLGAHHQQVKERSHTAIARSGESARNATLLAEAVTMILPTNAEAQQLLKEGRAATEKARAAMRDHAKAVAKSPAHLSHVGQIVFSKRPIELGREKEGDFSRQFAATDKIYAMAYLGDELAALYQGEVPNRRYFQVKVDGNKLDKADLYKEFTAADKKTSAFPFELLADADTATGQTFEGFVDVLRSLSPGQHEIRIEIPEMGIGGSFSLSWSDMNLDKLAATAQAASKKSLERVAATRVLPDECRTFLKQKDPALSEARLRSTLSQGMKGVARVLKIGVANLHHDSNEWSVTKNGIDIPLYRDTTRNICVAYRGEDERCYYLNEIGLRERYEGKQGFSDTPEVRYNYAAAVPIACGNIK